MTKPQEVFLLLLSNARHGTERAAKIYHEISQKSQIPEVREVLQARSFGTRILCNGIYDLLN